MRLRRAHFRWTRAQHVRAGLTATGASALCLALAAYQWAANDAAWAAAMMYGAVASGALGYRTLRRRGRRPRTEPPWLRRDERRTAAHVPAPPPREPDGDLPWLRTRTAGGSADAAVPPRPAGSPLDEPWEVVKQEGETIQTRMAMIARLLHFAPLAVVFVISFLFMADSLAHGELVGTTVSSGVCVAVGWFGVKFLRGDDDVDIGED